MGNFQEKLWAHLEVCEVPIHTSCFMLVREHGQRELAWNSELSICEIKSKSQFLDPIPAPLCFQFSTGADLQVLARQYSLYVRESDDPKTNFDLAVDRLTKLFGPGTDSGVANTIAKRWSHAYASLTATLFPADRNDFGENDRHELVPGSATECSIEIDTGFFIPLQEPVETWAVELFERLEHPSGSTIIFYENTRSNRYLSAAHPDTESGFDKTMNYFLQLDGHRANLIPVTSIKAVHRDTLLPARGDGAEYLGFEVEWSNGTVDRACVLQHPTPHGLEDFAAELAARLDVPLYEHADRDC